MTENNEARKILVLFSSPRKKGNSATLANEIIRGAESEGAIVETVPCMGWIFHPEIPGRSRTKCMKLEADVS
jgi:multimeric flavodoxin WrbA